MKINHLIFCLMTATLFWVQAPFLALASETKLQVEVVSSSDSKDNAKKAIPRIDEEAAYTEKTDRNLRVEKESKAVNAFSQNFWVFLFGAYVALLIFNLSVDFGKKQKIQWFLESAITFLAIFAWDQLDAGRTNRWFPAVVLESGIIIYIFYLYFRSKMLKLSA